MELPAGSTCIRAVRHPWDRGLKTAKLWKLVSMHYVGGVGDSCFVLIGKHHANCAHFFKLHSQQWERRKLVCKSAVRRHPSHVVVAVSAGIGWPRGLLRRNNGGTSALQPDKWRWAYHAQTFIEYFIGYLFPSWCQKMKNRTDKIFVSTRVILCTSVLVTTAMLPLISSAFANADLRGETSARNYNQCGAVRMTGREMIS